ncbi:MAG: glycosyltransferase family 4 protein [Sphingomonas sp.]
MRLTIVQYAGDYREAWERFERGGKATYQAQRYSVAFVSSLAQELEQVAVISAVTEQAYDAVLTNGVRAIGAGLKPGFPPRELLRLVSQTAPDQLVLVTPLVPIFKWARRNGIRVLGTLADSFQRGNVVSRLRHRRLASELNHGNVSWVGNHGIAACLSLLNIGVTPDKIIPWDWPPSHTPAEYEPRTRDPGATLRLIYVGTLSEGKGVGDLLRALGSLNRDGLKAALTIVGREPDGSMRELASRLDLDDQVQFAGLVPNEDIPAAMRSADAVVIPSRHEYPEGLPLTIYEALASRTPIIASDHPMFFGALTHGSSALIFPAGDDGKLAASIRRLSSDTQLYAELSRNSIDAWNALQLPVSWGELVSRWLHDTAADREWLNDRRLRSGLYDAQIAARTHV